MLLPGFISLQSQARRAPVGGALRFQRRQLSSSSSSSSTSSTSSVGPQAAAGAAAAPAAGAGAAAASAASDPQAESGTWCRQAEESEEMKAWAEPIVEEVLELYRCRPRPEIFDLYANDAVFDDPAGVLRGRSAIRLAMEALPRIFATGEPREVEVSYHPALVGGERNRFKAGGAGGADGGGGREQVKPQVCVQLVQCYTWLRPWSFTAPSRCSSPQPDQNAAPAHADMDVALPTVALLTLDPTTKRIVRHEDRWWGQATTYAGGAFLLGGLHGQVKRLNGALWEAWGRHYYG